MQIKVGSKIGIIVDSLHELQENSIQNMGWYCIDLLNRDNQ